MKTPKVLKNKKGKFMGFYGMGLVPLPKVKKWNNERHDYGIEPDTGYFS